MNPQETKYIYELLGGTQELGFTYLCKKVTTEEFTIFSKGEITNIQ